jgi:Na+/proline symporter
VVGVSILVLIYAGFAGLWGVVTTDFFQFFLAMLGAVIVAVFAVNHVGGIHVLIPKVQQATQQDVLSFFPLSLGLKGIQWSDAAGITGSTFAAYMLVQWWSWRRSDGGGEFIQRLIAAKDEAEAEKSAWLFNILNYVVRTWPWIVVGLVAIVVYPDLQDRELGYPKLMLDFLPPVILGLVVASLLAAFMSTVSTSINWGASFVTNDLYLRFIKPSATQEELVFVGRIASVLVTAFGAVAAFYAKDVATVFRLVIAIGTGSGLVLILRWFWWRINAAAELTAILGGFVVGLTTSVVPGLQITDFGWRLMFITLSVGVLWVAVMLLTQPESNETLDEFYRKVRPSGPGWQRQRDRLGLEPLQDLGTDIQRVLASILLMFGTMFTVGGFLLLQTLTGWVSLIIAVVGGMWLRQLNKIKSLPMPRPGLDD